LQQTNKEGMEEAWKEGVKNRGGIREFSEYSVERNLNVL
jgi:hypothetical protein